MSSPTSTTAGRSTSIVHIDAQVQASAVRLYAQHFIAGATGLTAAFAVVHPLDTLRTRMQAGSTSTTSRMASIVNPSITRTLFKGFLPSVLGAAPQGGIRLATYELTKRKLSPYLESSPMLCSAVSAICGDMASSLVKIPREVITQNLQTNRYPNTWSAVTHIVGQDGISGLFRGGVSTSCRDIPFMVILFTCYESMKSRRWFSDHKHATAELTLFGGISGALAGFFTTPPDVVKTRIMTSDAGIRSRSMLKVSKQLYAENGVSAFFIGTAPRCIWWFSVCSVFFPTYEMVKSSLISEQHYD